MSPDDASVRLAAAAEHANVAAKAAAATLLTLILGSRHLASVAPS
jgi:hypothetical protein